MGQYQIISLSATILYGRVPFVIHIIISYLLFCDVKCMIHSEAFMHLIFLNGYCKCVFMVYAVVGSVFSLFVATIVFVK